MRDAVNNRGNRNRQKRTDEQRQNKTRLQSGKINAASDRHQTRADNRAGQTVRRRNRKTRQRRQNHRRARADGDG